jgi:hypothetical protein
MPEHGSEKCDCFPTMHMHTLINGASTHTHHQHQCITIRAPQRGRHLWSASVSPHKVPSKVPWAKLRQELCSLSPCSSSSTLPHQWPGQPHWACHWTHRQASSTKWRFNWFLAFVSRFRTDCTVTPPQMELKFSNSGWDESMKRFRIIMKVAVNLCLFLVTFPFTDQHSIKLTKYSNCQ